MRLPWLHILSPKQGQAHAAHAKVSSASSSPPSSSSSSTKACPTAKLSGAAPPSAAPRGRPATAIPSQQPPPFGRPSTAVPSQRTQSFYHGGPASSPASPVPGRPQSQTRPRTAGPRHSSPSADGSSAPLSPALMDRHQKVRHYLKPTANAQTMPVRASTYTSRGRAVHPVPKRAYTEPIPEVEVVPSGPMT